MLQQQAQPVQLSAMAAAEVSTSAVYAHWKEFDLDSRRSKLDEVRFMPLLSVL